MKKRTIYSLLFFVGILVLSTIVSRYFFYRFDLTSDGRYTLSQATRQIVSKIQSPIVIDVLLSGNIPAQYKPLQLEILQLLEEYRALNNHIIFRFSNPIDNAKNPNKVLEELTQYGLFPLQITTAEQGKTSQEYILPWAMVNSEEKTEKVALLKNKLGATPQELIELSVQNLEYAFTDALNKILLKKSKNIAILKSNGTLNDLQIADFLQLEGNYYNLAPFTLDSASTQGQKTLDQLTQYQLMIIAKPTQPFSDQQKQIIDQYIMQGGRVLWLIDQVAVELEDLYLNQGKTIAMPLDLNLADLLFKYGVRINYDLITDLYFTQIVVAQGSGSQSQYTPIPWLYHPMILSKNNHLINKNLDAIRIQFANSIDTLANAVHKEVLLSSSALSRVEGTPTEIRLENKTINRDLYKKGSLPVAVLLEGHFSSAYKNRIKPIPLKNHTDEGNFSKMIIISDGDIIRNDISQNIPLELGYDKWTNNFYDNKLFLQNCVNYLLDDTALLQLRNKKTILPLLDKKQLTSEQRNQWKIMSIILPLGVITLMAIGVQFWYKRRFARKVKAH